MKRHIITLACASLTLALTGCGGGDVRVNPQSGATASASPSTSGGSTTGSPSGSGSTGSTDSTGSTGSTDTSGSTDTGSNTGSTGSTDTNSGGSGTGSAGSSSGSTDTSSSTLPAAGSWVIVSSSDAGIPVDTYTQSDAGASPSTLHMTGDDVHIYVQVTPVLVPTSTALPKYTNQLFVTQLYLRDDGARYIVTLQTGTDAGSTSIPNNYACVSASFTSTELKTMGLNSLPYCTGTLTIDVVNLTYTSTGLTVPQIGGSGQIVLQANGSWPSINTDTQTPD